jgi:prepilin-type N-terminal cleavage/methylation domain-containing protein
MKHSKPKGFTIIEVIIVLVIGAVIMIAVFLVVPQLQREQRNSRRASEARRLLVAMQQFRAEGKQYSSGYNNVAACGSFTGTNTTELENITGKLKRPEGGDFTVNIRNCVPVSAGGVINTTNLDRIFIISGAKCENGILSVQQGSDSVNYPIEPFLSSSYKTLCLSN